jgi:hypothetical protein
MPENSGTPTGLDEALRANAVEVRETYSWNLTRAEREEILRGSDFDEVVLGAVAEMEGRPLDPGASLDFKRAYLGAGYIRRLRAQGVRRAVAWVNQYAPGFFVLRDEDGDE